MRINTFYTFRLGFGYRYWLVYSGNLTKVNNNVFVSDCLVLYVYKERGVKERCSVTLEHICGLEVHVCGDGVSFTLSILCLTQTAVLGFDSREALHSWDLRLRYCLGEGGRHLPVYIYLTCILHKLPSRRLDVEKMQNYGSPEPQRDKKNWRRNKYSY